MDYWNIVLRFFLVKDKGETGILSLVSRSLLKSKFITVTSSLVDHFSPQKYKVSKSQMPVSALKWLENLALFHFVSFSLLWAKVVDQTTHKQVFPFIFQHQKPLFLDNVAKISALKRLTKVFSSLCSLCWWLQLLVKHYKVCFCPITGWIFIIEHCNLWQCVSTDQCDISIFFTFLNFWVPWPTFIDMRDEEWFSQTSIHIFLK